jgi:cell wall-associated NlpC family hydrolase
MNVRLGFVPGCGRPWLALVATDLALLGLVVAAPCHGQVAAPEAPAARDAIQEGPGDGDAGQSEQIDESEGAKPQDGPYRSPYRLVFKAPLRELLFDAEAPRGRVEEQSSVPVHEWYSARVRKEWGAWGVPARRFDCPPRVARESVEWRRERVVAAAGRFIGYDYQHHHVPDWKPPAGWPWKQCCAGRNGRGVDCSNFSGWNYNWALGIHISTDVHKQAVSTTAHVGQREIHAQVIERPAGESRDWYDSLVADLRPGDLLYIGNRERTKVTHVIMWVGECGEGPSDTPLVIDSTGGRIKDCEGHAIPCGIHLRPFRKGSWYHASFHHAHRWLR